MTTRTASGPQQPDVAARRGDGEAGTTTRLPDAATLPDAAAPLRLLVSVKSVDEALLVAQSGAADFIDLKEPGQGALGGLPTATIRAIVEALRTRGCALPVSATIGDWPAHRLAEIMDAVDAVGACGVDYVKVGIVHGTARTTAAASTPRPADDVKVGIGHRKVAVAASTASTAAATAVDLLAPHGPAGGAADALPAVRSWPKSLASGGDRADATAEVPHAAHPAIARLLDALAASRWPVVPVFIGDGGVDAATVAHACRLRVERGAACFPALMVDTAAKRGGSLFARVSTRALRRFLVEVRQTGALAGLAGALRLPDLPALAALSPDFAGFRSAVCAGDRAGALDAALLALLAERLRHAQRRSPSEMVLLSLE